MDFSEEDILLGCTNQDEFHLIVLPTEQCNFRCLYCYEDHVNRRMTKATVNAILLLLERKIENISHLFIDWFGGEPLLELPIIQRINSYIQHHIDTSNPSVSFTSAITTNGYLLTEAVFSGLLRLGITHYQITLDGTEEQHDSTRIHANGGKTFETIWMNLNSMKKSQKSFEVVLRLQLMQSNLSNIQAIIYQIEKAFCGDARFKIYLKPIRNLGGARKEFCSKESLGDDNQVLKAFENLLRSSSRFWEPNPVCYAARLNSLMIRPDGSIAKCTVALNDPLNAIGQLRQDGRLTLQKEKLVRWSRGLFNNDKSQLYCPNRGIHSDNLV